MRQTLLDCCGLDWGRISPAIFGSLFQSIMDKTARRNLGAHYTSEGNILKLIKPLFLDELWAEFERIKTNAKRLLEFQQKLRSLTFLDPACGCGNFLVIAYRELRQLELEVLRAARAGDQLALDVSSLILVDVDQFYGIEIEEFPAQIAQVALWLMDHQMNLQVSQEFGAYFARIPLHARGTIVHANALQLDWNEVITADKLSYIMGNPPFVGAKMMSKEQRADVAEVFKGIKNAGLLDFVAAWYVKAANMMQNTGICCAFVSTNSITQGEQVSVLWDWMLKQGTNTFFAHRTFRWANEARGKAAVDCVIIGFSLQKITPKRLFEYEDIKGEPLELLVKNINPYLVDAGNTTISNRRQPLCDVPAIGIGNKPIDGGNYLFTADEKEEFLRLEPQAAPYMRRWLGSHEFLNGYHRYCLWLGDTSPAELKKMPESLKRIQAVKAFREASKGAPTQKLAQRRHSFMLRTCLEYLTSYFHEFRQNEEHFCPLGLLTNTLLPAIQPS